MKNAVIKVIKEELEINEKYLEQCKGGMEQYINSLEDSSTFYNEASTLGCIETLKGLLKKIGDLKTDDSLTTSNVKTKTVVYRPDFEKLPDYVNYELSNVWLNKEALETSLYSDAVDISFIEKINTNEIDYSPMLVDSDDYFWDTETLTFRIRDEKYLKNIIGKNANLVIQNPEKVLKFFFGESVSNVFFGLDGEENNLYYINSLWFDYKNSKYHLEIKNNKDIKLFKDNNDDWDLMLDITTKNQYSIVDLNNVRVLINISEDILDEYKNEIFSDIIYNSKDDGSGNGYITVENNRYGFEIDNFKIEYKWMQTEYDYIEIDGVSFEFCGASKLEMSYIYADIFLSESEIVPSLIDYCRGKGIYIESNKAQIEYKLIADKYVAKIEDEYYIADNAEGLNRTLMEYLPLGNEMTFLNAFNKAFEVHMKVSDFNNDYSKFEEKVLVKFKEGEDDDTDGVCYVISNLVTEITLNHAIKITKKIWDLIDVNDVTSTFDDYAKIISNEFGMDLYEILEDEQLPNNWYSIFEKVLPSLNIEFHNIKEKEIVI